MRNYVIINGVNSLTKNGLAIKDLPPITKTMMRTLREEIDGRDGDIITELGYSAYDKSMTIGLFGTGYDIDDIIAFFNQSGTIVFSNEPDKFYNFKIIEQIDYNKLLKFKEATIRFHCQPFKYPLNEVPLEEEYQYVNGTGTEITLNNTSENIFNKFDLFGNTSQASYSGINLYNVYDIKSRSTSLFSEDSNDFTTFSRSGSVSATVYNADYKNVSSLLSVSTDYWILIEIKEVSYSGTTPIISFVSNNTSGDKGQFSTTVSYPFDQLSNGQKIKAKITTRSSFEDCTCLTRKIFTYYSGTTSAKLVYRISILKDEPDVSSFVYQPYTGGVPAPNPSYPQDVHVVSGDNYINISGENIFNIQDGIKTSSNLTATIKDGIISVNGNSTATSFIMLIQNTFSLKAGTYTISAFNDSLYNDSQFDLRITGKNGNGILGRTYLNVINSSTTFTLNEDLEEGCLQIRASSGDTLNNFVIKPMLVKGNITPNDFKKYISQSYPLYLGVENLFDKNNANIINGGISNKLINSGESNRLLYIRVMPNTTYTIQRRNDGDVNRFRAGSCSVVPADGVSLPNAIEDDNATSITITTGANDTYLAVMFYRTAETQVTYQEVLDSIIINKGSLPCHVSSQPIEMASIPNTDYKDTFVKIDDVWYVHKVIGKVVLDGSENWQLRNTSANGTKTYSLNNTPSDYLLKNTWSTNEPYALCDKFIVNHTVYGAADMWGDLLDVIGISLYYSTGTSRYIYINTTEDLPTYLANNNATLLYLLATPTNIPIEDTTLIEQLEAIKNAVSYEGQTNITQTDNDLPFILDLSALELNSDHLVIDNIGNIFSKPTLDLEGTGIVDIYLNDIQMFEVDLTENNEIIINTDEMEAFNPETGALANRLVTGEYDVFKLDPGENDLRFSGNLTKATITNYERWL